MCGPVEREFIGEAAPKIYKEFPQIINKKKQPNSQLGKRIHRKGNTNGPYMCEKMFLFIGNQGHEKLPTILAKIHKSDNLKCWEGHRATGTPMYL